MSDHAHVEPQAEYFDYRNFGGRLLTVIILAVALYGLTLFGWIVDKKQFAFSYLFAYFFFLTICMGGLFWNLVHHAMDVEWSVVVRRQMENLASLLPVMALLFIPLIFVRDELWYWMTYPAGKDVLLDEKAAYLNVPFFFIRAGFYFLFFTLAGWLLRKASTNQDKDGLTKHTFFMRKVTFASAPLFAVSLTFAGIDWLMGLDFHWFSTMWGVYIFAGTALSSMCVLILTITALRAAGYLRNVITLEHYHIMGKLTLAFTIFWAYIGFSQYMLIWYANIPEETIYFLRRNTESWNTLNYILIGGHFFIPFLLLLPQPAKRKVMYLCCVTVLILAMHLLDMYIIVLPALHKAGVVLSWMDPVCVAAIGCILLAVFLKRLGDSALYPLRDPRLPQSLRLKN